jgi:hypothetical protein
MAVRELRSRGMKVILSFAEGCLVVKVSMSEVADATLRPVK